MDYRQIADGIAADIRSGRLAVGARLPPQRDFAYAQGIAVSTASRVYAELVKRGLVTGEVGRGTYVRPAPPAPAAALSEPAAAAIDLELNCPVLPGQEALIAASLSALLHSGELTASLRPVGPAGTPAAQQIAASFLTRQAFTVAPGALRFTACGKQAVAAAFAAIAQPGERIGVEVLSYPLASRIAARLGVGLVPVPVDGEGVVPEALVRIHRTTPLAGLYLQPTLHNPLGITMGLERRRWLAEFLNTHGLIAIEDAVYGFLAPEETPLAALAPAHILHIDSLSKRLAPGMTLGFLVCPEGLLPQITRAIRTGGWSPTGVSLALVTHLMACGAAAGIEEGKRADARLRQQVARRVLQGLTLRGDPRAYNLLLELPPQWRAQTYAAAAGRAGIAVTPAAEFAMGSSSGPNAVRLALASPPLEALSEALQRLRELALARPAGAAGQA